MSESRQQQRYVELFDISKKASIAKSPLAGIPHLPRMGERVFLRSPQSGDWEAYTVVAVEYFVASSEPSAGEELVELTGTDRVTLYVEPSR